MVSYSSSAVLAACWIAVKIPESVFAFTCASAAIKGAADGEADAPTGHVECLRQAVEFDNVILRPGDLQDARRGSVEVHLVVGGVLRDHEVVRPRQLDHALEEGKVGGRRRWGCWDS